MRFSAQEQYALLGMFDLAYNGGAEAVQVRVIGVRQGVPTRYLEQIFQPGPAQVKRKPRR